jgi:hypothetical protein
MHYQIQILGADFRLRLASLVGRATSYVLFRSATEMIHRDIYRLTSADGARTFRE